MEKYQVMVKMIKKRPQDQTQIVGLHTGIISLLISIFPFVMLNTFFPRLKKIFFNHYILKTTL